MCVCSKASWTANGSPVRAQTKKAPSSLRPMTTSQATARCQGTRHAPPSHQHARCMHPPLVMNFLLSTLRDWKVTLLPMAAGNARWKGKQWANA